MGAKCGFIMQIYAVYSFAINVKNSCTLRDINASAICPPFYNVFLSILIDLSRIF